MTDESPKYTPEQIAQLKTDRILDGVRTDAILTIAKSNETPPEEVFNQIFNKDEDLELLGRTIKIVNLVKDLYGLLGLEKSFKDDILSTILRGYVCCIREEYNDPWYTEWDTYFTTWETIEDVVKSVLAFHDLEIEALFRGVKNVDRVWLTQYMAETKYLAYNNFVGNAEALATLKR